MKEMSFEDVKKVLDAIENNIIKNPKYKFEVLGLRASIDEIYPHNSSDNELHAVQDLNNKFVSISGRINKIEECLGINLVIDNNQPDIDYSYIRDEFTRDKIIAYYREMLRYQYGTRNHKICFGEFCRLATIQIEYMLNDFYSEKIETLKKEVAEYQFNDAQKKYDVAFDKWKKIGGKQPDKPIEDDFPTNIKGKKEIEEIGISYKGRAFCEFHLKERDKKIAHNGTSFIISWTSNMRNRKSHGGHDSIDFPENLYLTDKEIETVKLLSGELEKNGYSLDGYSVRGAIKGMPNALRKKYNDAKEILWIRERPFNDVVKLLKIIARSCATSW